ASARRRRTASLARPRSGASATRTFHTSPCLPTTAARLAPGLTRRRSRVVSAPMAPSLCRTEAVSGCVGVVDDEPPPVFLRCLVENGGRLVELCAQAARRRDKAVVLDDGAALDLARLGLRLGEDQLSLATRVSFQLLGCLLCRDERRAE